MTKDEYMNLVYKDGDVSKGINTEGVGTSVKAVINYVCYFAEKP